MIPLALQLSIAATVILTLSGFASSANAPTMNSLALNGIAHVAFRVSNIQTFREFYEKLGFEQAFELSKAGKVTEAFIKINDRQFVELYPPDEGQSLGLMHVCFEASDLALLNQEYVKRGLTPSAVRKAGAGNLLFTLHDPEGQLLEYTQYMPGSMHSNDRGNHLGSHRISDHLLGATAAVSNLAMERSFYVDKLGFESASQNHEMRLRMPGNSGEEITLESSPLAHQKPTLTFAVSNLQQAIHSLRAIGVPVKDTTKRSSVTDPDGNVIAFQQN